MYDGWRVFLPVPDHGHQTDTVISDGPNFLRIHVKTTEARGEGHWLHNSWKDIDVDVIVVFVRKSNWGVVVPAFVTNRRRLTHKDNCRFMIDRNEFLKEFHKLEVDWKEGRRLPD